MLEKETIINKAEDLILRYGVKSVTMDDICKKLGISKKTLYQMVDDKKSLIREIINQHISNDKEIISKIQANASNAIDELMQIAEYVVSMLKKMSPYVVYDLKKYHHQSWQIMEEFHRSFVKQVIERNLKNGISEGYYRETINTDILSKLYMAKTMIIVDEEIFPSSKYNREGLYREFLMHHLYGILSEKGLKYLSSENKIFS